MNPGRQARLCLQRTFFKAEVGALSVAHLRSRHPDQALDREHGGAPEPCLLTQQPAHLTRTPAGSPLRFHGLAHAAAPTPGRRAHRTLPPCPRPGPTAHSSPPPCAHVGLPVAPLTRAVPPTPRTPDAEPSRGRRPPPRALPAALGPSQEGSLSQDRPPGLQGAPLLCLPKSMLRILLNFLGFFKMQF